ncbi:iron complex transport system ATP-binding protein [Jatrophihabitans endophyticus]|uniref:Iron complex transport system ATP-binding protein n=1 Tax=Jatrophihabitans endophyticus TaxID=1206085 RepID=A0A1M5GI66_9ACTN|nr:ABC transporter ATP-binding protein [Jatrophihabitans endophyticus]SHG03440.1 iron complex transport system ATP-binding protein [Jatrophihabitans endophyticus]
MTVSTDARPAEHELRAAGLHLGYEGRTVVTDLDLTVPPGRVTAIVGPNGCGKSTLLRGLGRLLRPTSGQVVLDGSDIHSLRTRDVATTLGLLPQHPVAPDGITVAELVGRGRHPHQRWFSPWSGSDDEIVATALRATSTLDVRDRAVDALSGGQRQRVWIAMALAQQTDILLLDEPTTFLDVTHQIEVLDLLADLNRDHGTTIVMVLHDLNLAARYAHHVVLMCEGRVTGGGAPAEVITAAAIRDTFALESLVVADPVSGSPMVVPMGRLHRADTSSLG